MGQALLRGIIGKNFTSRRNILCCDKDRKKLNALRLSFRVSVTNLISEVIESCSVIILAVKPQDIDRVLREVSSPLKGKLFISICAGITSKDLENQLIESGDIQNIEPRPSMTNKLQKKLEKWLQIAELDL